MCSVIDAAELCRNVHADKAYRLAAEDAFGTLSGYIHTLNANMKIFQHLRDIVPPVRTKQPPVSPDAESRGKTKLTVEEEILAIDMLHELETEGETVRE